MSFTGQFGFIMATAGAAVGLGNIWRFPYLAGENGGGAFVLLYIALTLIMSFPILLAEVSLGRASGSDPISNFETFHQRYNSSKSWKALAYLGALTLFMVLSFYSVLSGWTIYYLLNSLNIAQHTSLWTELMSNSSIMLGFGGIFTLLTFGVVGFGVIKGIERLSKVLMPALLLLLVALVAASSLLGDFSAGMEFLLQPDFSEINGRVVLMAAGQALFTLATGAGAMMVYGAYLPRTTPMLSSLATVVVINIVVALLSGLAIFPMVFGFDIAPSAGPGLMYQTLPLIFVQLPFGQLIAAGFFGLLLFAAWTSSISMAEPLVLIGERRLGLSRLKSCALFAALTFLMGLATVYAFTVKASLLTFLIDIPSDLFLPLGGLGFMLFAMKYSEPVRDALGKHFNTWHKLRYVVVLITLVILADGVHDIISALL